MNAAEIVKHREKSDAARVAFKFLGKPVTERLWEVSDIAALQSKTQGVSI